jgi:hypothetical protein
MRRIHIHYEAAKEVEEAAAWYERERPGLGADFHEAAEAALDLLQEEVVPLVSLPGKAGALGLKRLMLRRFPYSVVVRLTATEVFVIAFAHNSRRPGYWRKRL